MKTYEQLRNSARLTIAARKDITSVGFQDLTTSDYAENRKELEGDVESVLAAYVFMLAVPKSNEPNQISNSAAMAQYVNEWLRNTVPLLGLDVEFISDGAFLCGAAMAGFKLKRAESSRYAHLNVPKNHVMWKATNEAMKRLAEKQDVSAAN